jgi:polyphenol oxidase
LTEDATARLAFTDRAFGNVSLEVGGGDAFGARGALPALVGLEPEALVGMEQVHGAAVAHVGKADLASGAAPGVDALVSTDSGVALAVLVADCVPVLLAAPGRGVAAVHAGRRGIAAGVVPAAVEALTWATATPARSCVAVLGPAIGGCCYELPDPLVDEVARGLPQARSTTSWGAPSLDLPTAARVQLVAAGVDRIERVAACTACEPAVWFSHRASGGGHAAPGRQAGVIARVPQGGAPPCLH